MEIPSEYSLSKNYWAGEGYERFQKKMVPIFLTTDLGETKSESSKPNTVFLSKAPCRCFRCFGSWQYVGTSATTPPENLKKATKGEGQKTSTDLQFGITIQATITYPTWGFRQQKSWTSMCAGW